jgi:hypothetical protein
VVEDAHLVVAADGRDDGGDLGVAKRPFEFASPLFGVVVQVLGVRRRGGVLDRLDVEFGQPL